MEQVTGMTRQALDTGDLRNPSGRLCNKEAQVC